MVRRSGSGWVVEINPSINPKIRVNPEYSALIKRNDTSPDQSYLKEQMQEARWFIKSLQQRNETLLKVSTEIMRVQKDFLEQGDQGMRPLVLHDIAEAVELHESTISRVTTQKFIDTPLGIYELKYFSHPCQYAFWWRSVFHGDSRANQKTSIRREHSQAAIRQ